MGDARDQRISGPKVKMLSCRAGICFEFQYWSFTASFELDVLFSVGDKDMLCSAHVRNHNKI